MQGPSMASPTQHQFDAAFARQDDWHTPLSRGGQPICPANRRPTRSVHVKAMGCTRMLHWLWCPEPVAARSSTIPLSPEGPQGLTAVPMSHSPTPSPMIGAPARPLFRSIQKPAGAGWDRPRRQGPHPASSDWRGSSTAQHWPSPSHQLGNDYAAETSYRHCACSKKPSGMSSAARPQ